MKKWGLWISVWFLTFSIGLTCASLWLPGQTSTRQKATVAETTASSKSENMELSFCQVAAEPEKYEGKVIRLSAVYSFGLHGVTIGDASCSSEDLGTSVSITPAIWEEFERATEKAYGTKVVGPPLYIIAIGKFQRNNPSHASDGWEDRLPFRFELKRIEKAVRTK